MAEQDECRLPEICEELGGIAKKALFVVMGVAMIVLGNGFLAALGLSGAII
ncbi:MAG: hypothetical protein ACYCVY_11705 [Acidiferrobacteraceae bacterium]